MSSSLRKNQEVESLFSLLRGGGSGAVFDYLVVSRVFDRPCTYAAISLGMRIRL